MDALDASSLRELINIRHVRAVLELSYRVAGVPVEVMDADGTVLVSVGQPDVCVQFHHRHAAIAAQCRRKAGRAGSMPHPSSRCVPFQCASRLWDWVAPIVIEGRPAGAVCFGPFLIADGRLDLDLFRRQAREFGFEVDAYLTALASIPILDQERVDALVEYYSGVVGFLAARGREKLALDREMLARAQTELALRASEARYRALVQAIPDMMFRVGADLTITDFHAPESAELLVARDKVIGTRISEVPFPPGVEAAISAGVRQALATRQPQRVEYAVTLSSGLRHYESLIQPIGDEVFAIVRDFSARKEQEEKLAQGVEALRQSEERFRLLAQAMGEGVGVIDEEQRFVLVNPAAESILGVAPGTLKGKSLSEFLAPEQLQALQEQRHAWARGEKSACELEIRRADGERRWITVTATPFNGAGAEGAACAIFRDITQLKQAAQERRKAARLEWAATLASGVAREVSNLMVTVIGHAASLRGGPADQPDVAASLAAISSAALQAGNLTKRLLDYVQDGLRQPREMSLNDAVREALKAPAGAEPQSVVLVCELDPELWPIEADPAQMAQVVLQLYRNATEAIASEGRISIRTRNLLLNGEGVSHCARLKMGRYVSLVIEDTGCGMDAASLDRVFETKFPGPGLGLAAAHDIVKRYGGEILASSQKGAGSRFEVRLPALTREAGE